MGWGPGQPELVWGNQPTAGGWRWADLKVPSNTNHSVILHNPLFEEIAPEAGGEVVFTFQKV